jgi:hypothetical protein
LGFSQANSLLKEMEEENLEDEENVTGGEEASLSGSISITGGKSRGDNSSTNAQLYDLSVPTTAEFETVVLLFQHCQSHAKLNGYAVSIKSSNKDRKITIKCDFGGKYRKLKKHMHLRKEGKP